jgi:hypothetical protein
MQKAVYFFQMRELSHKTPYQLAGDFGAVIGHEMPENVFKSKVSSASGWTVTPFRATNKAPTLEDLPGR